MEKKFLYPAAILLIMAVISCRKNEGTINPGNGKWQETKLTMFQINGSGSKQFETIFTQPFTSADFAEFSDSSTFNLGEDHYYYMNTTGQQPNLTQEIAPVVGIWHYTALGNNKYVLNTDSYNLNPGGFEIADTVTIINSHTLWLHVVGYSSTSANKNISDSYYSR